MSDNDNNNDNVVEFRKPVVPSDDTPLFNARIEESGKIIIHMVDPEDDEEWVFLYESMLNILNIIRIRRMEINAKPTDPVS